QPVRRLVLLIAQLRVAADPLGGGPQPVRQPVDLGAHRSLQVVAVAHWLLLSPNPTLTDPRSGTPPTVSDETRNGASELRGMLQCCGRVALPAFRGVAPS